MRRVQCNVYVVRDGETLEDVAKKFGVNPTSLLLANNITPKHIRKGFVLYIPN